MKSKIENDIVEKSARALNLTVKASGKTITKIAKDSFIGRGYLDELKDGKKRLNIVHIVKIANAINKYPSELLPTEWQKPTTYRVDDRLLAEVMQEIKKAAKKDNKILTLEEECFLASYLYNRKIERKTENDNWMISI